MEFRAKKNKRINNNSLVEINKAKSVNLKWRYQKNLDNGQVISYVKDSKYKKHCFVEASKRIHKRAKRLSIKEDNPIAVYTEIKERKEENSLHRRQTYHFFVTRSCCLCI